GNVLVQGEELRLVDYDGMFVPALAGAQANETGHPAYQHPARSARDFGPEIDRFSALVVLVALHALAARPALWSRHANGDNLLFRPADFRDPAGSALWAELRALADPALEAPLEALERACADPTRAPPLDQLYRRRGGKRGDSGNGRAGWWKEYLPKDERPGGGGSGSSRNGPGPERPWWSPFAGDRGGRATATGVRPATDSLNGKATNGVSR